MLFDKREKEIIASARQKNVRDPHRSRAHFDNIFDDFLHEQDFTGKSFIDIGAGQFDFCELARNKGARCTGIDNDPAVLELGKHKGFEVLDANIKHLFRSDGIGQYDGVFNKFSLNAFWHATDEEAHKSLVDFICGMIKPDGWAWIAPWNGVPKNMELPQRQIDRTLEVQIERFSANGFTCIHLTPELRVRYGVNGAVANNPLFIRNLKWSRA